MNARASIPVVAPAPALIGDLSLALSLFALDPAGSGLLLRGGHGPVRERVLSALAGLLSALHVDGSPWRRVPLGIGDDRLLGGLDLTATLSAGRPVAARGLLAEADGSVLLLPLVEHVPASQITEICSVLDRGELSLARDGVTEHIAVRLGVLALDESELDESGCSPALADRLLLHVDLPAVSTLTGEFDVFELASASELRRARERRASIYLPDVSAARVCEVADAFGVLSLRAVRGVLAIARSLAALSGVDAVDDEILASASRLVLGPRATRMPAVESEIDPVPEPQRPEDSASPDAESKSESEPDDDGDLGPDLSSSTDVLLEAVATAVPADVLAGLAGTTLPRLAPRSGRAGAARKGSGRGRPAGTRAGLPRHGERLALVETLRTAAPWQALRGRAGPHAPVQIRAEDFRIVRRKVRTPTLTIFAVDASGSAAVQRLAEAKGAIEHLLAECYVRRDEVALVAFRGTGAEVLLPPTRSLLRARRSLSALPGGGGTPLAAGLVAADRLAADAERAGSTPVLVLLTDGRANVTLAGDGDRRAARTELETLTRRIAARGVATVVIDTSRRPGAAAQTLSDQLGARYRPLPVADGAAVSAEIRALQTEIAA